MELEPGLYRFFVRPKWFTKLYIHNHIMDNCNFHNKTVLDFGCGTGSISCLFPHENYLGVDYSYDRIAYAQRLYPNYNFSVLERNKLPVSDKSIDCIIIISVLHHISSEQLLDYLQEFHRVLKPDGQILVVEPCFFNNCHISNHFMSILDKGKFIRNEDEYLDIFNGCHYKTKVLKKFNQLFFYKKLLFTAVPN